MTQISGFYCPCPLLPHVPFYHKPGTGTVVGYVHEYVTKTDKNREVGIYLNNSRFPEGGYLVRTDDTDRLVCVPLDCAVLTAKYNYGIKALHRRRGKEARVGDHNPPLFDLKEDIVRLVTDTPDVERAINQVSFTRAGEAKYYVSMTSAEAHAENQRRKNEAKKRDRAWSPVFFGGTIGVYTRDQIVFVRKGEPGKLSGSTFPGFDLSSV